MERSFGTTIVQFLYQYIMWKITWWENVSKNEVLLKMETIFTFIFRIKKATVEIYGTYNKDDYFRFTVH